MKFFRVILAIVGCFCLILAGLMQSNQTQATPLPRPRQLRVMTFNIHIGIGLDQRLDLPRIAEIINREQPDLVGLQEVDRGVERTQRVDQIAELARLTKLEYAFAPNLDHQGGKYGVAILSRFPLLASEHRLLANPRKTEQRGLLRVEVKVYGRKLNFVNTHLDFKFEDGRLAETEQVLQAIKSLKTPVIVVGDFNDLPMGSAYRLMTSRLEDAWVRSQPNEPGFTSPASKPVRRIDYIFYSRTKALRPVRAWIIETLASDHLPVVADFALR